MIKSHLFREALGLTQEETAMLLKITISQLAMFEIGQRDLPVNAKLQLIKMHNHVIAKQQEKMQHPIVRNDAAKIKEIIAKELLDNQYAQLVLERKIKEAKHKYNKSISALQLAEYLDSLPAEGEIPDKGLTEIIHDKAIRGIEKYGLPVQMKYSIKLQALQNHQKELEKSGKA
ncbi:helix-turn-helix domain-containing protein [Flavobacterium humi]|uniref:XRE family transcriptional regulator n=1 Tax=Flavobacterium humi TaxID=2562683 RepID=A0A4Z0LCR0_9FLAO|nr:helix-turn-helix transcriptional regulator [Flavobacterium humi]TGD59657.1 XRE family transcriptional regulator [Flavobacterium humi]